MENKGILVLSGIGVLLVAGAFIWLVLGYKEGSTPKTSLMETSESVTLSPNAGVKQTLDRGEESVNGLKYTKYAYYNGQSLAINISKLGKGSTVFKYGDYTSEELKVGYNFITVDLRINKGEVTSGLLINGEEEHQLIIEFPAYESESISHGDEPVTTEEHPTSDIVDEEQLDRIISDDDLNYIER